MLVLKVLLIILMCVPVVWIACYSGGKLIDDVLEGAKTKKKDNEEKIAENKRDNRRKYR